MQFFQLNVTDVTNPFVNNILVSKFYTDGLKEINVPFTSLQVKFHSKNSTLNFYLTEHIYELKNKSKT